MSIGEAEWQEPKKSKREASSTRGWWKTFTDFIDHQAPETSAGATVIWLILFRLSSDRTVIVSVERLATRSGYSSRQVKRFLAELIDAGLLSRISQGNRIKGATRYRVRHAKPQRIGSAS